MAKSFSLDFDRVLYDLSYANILMFSATLPTYTAHKDKAQSKEINGDDPANNYILDSIIKNQ